MFSYLQGIRPNNRRSGITQAAAPSQNTSSRYYHERSPSSRPFNSNIQPQSQAAQASSVNEASPVSPHPPVLPPIPRVASRHEPPPSAAERSENQEQAIGLPETPQWVPQEIPPSISVPSPSKDSEPTNNANDPPSRTFEEMGFPSANHTDKLHPAPSRRKRPIDVFYQSMRSNSEPSHRQAINGPCDNRPSIPLPNREPPPPPSKISHLQPPERQASISNNIPQSSAPAMAVQKAHGKAKLNLLNPMALLARRRSSQAVEEAYSQSASTPRLPDNFDPRIRGKVVHDFSAPRPGRPLSSNGASKGQDEANGRLFNVKRKVPSPNGRSASKVEADSPSSIEKEHTPIFKENFDDSVEPWTSDMDSPAKRRSSAFMYQVSLQASQPPEPSALPAFARNLPSKFPNDIDSLQRKSTPPPNQQLEVLLETPTPDQKSAKSTPPTSSPKARSRATSNTDPSFPTLGSPQRFKSNASRFSFDLAGVGSAAQEKLLEEKHRQKAKQKERESLLTNDNDGDDEDDYADYDDIDDGLEERIPGVNADAEDSDAAILQHAVGNVHFVSPNKSSFESVTSPGSTGLTSPSTPLDGQGHPIDSVTKTLRTLSHVQLANPSGPSKEQNLRPKSSPGAALDPGFDTSPLKREAASESNLAGLPRRYELQDDDDMYFDDGMIEDFEEGEPQTFDESVFDDDTNKVYGLPIRDLKPIPKSQENPNLGSQSQDSSLTQQNALDLGAESLAHSPLQPPTEFDTMAKSGEVVTESDRPLRVQSNHTVGLTQDNLGLHDRLAFAANQAALEGKFNRTYSQGSTLESHDGPNSSLGTTTQDNHINLPTSGLHFSRMNDDVEDFTFDDTHTAFTEAEDDDPIIAAANAEALENDDDGFYGHEFGFFARKPGSSESEYANGGYFGARALEGVHRMNSGRDNFLEPSLTPITERSEWSNRNSMVSLAQYGYPLSAQYQSNPQLADLMRVKEGEEMSLEALRRFRRGAWGGSNGSLQSSSNSPNNGSPLTYLPPNMVAPLMQPTNSNGSLISPNSQTLAGSFHSFNSGGQASSNDSNPSPSAESPTITLPMSQTGLMMQPQPMGPPPPPPKESSPVKRNAPNQKPWVPGHSRASSGAESVSYREENGKWFCERTRVIEETGEVEVLERSVIEGGRI